MNRRGLLQSASLASAAVLLPAAPPRLRVFQYGNGFCVSAVSVEAACAYIRSLLPWSWSAYDDVLVTEVPDARLDQKCHFYGNEEGEEFGHLFRVELDLRIAAGQMEPDTFYDQMCLIPTGPSYSPTGWCEDALGVPGDERFYWTTDGKSIRKAAHRPSADPGSECPNWQWSGEDGGPLVVTHWHCSDASVTSAPKLLPESQPVA